MEHRGSNRGTFKLCIKGDKLCIKGDKLCKRGDKIANEEIKKSDRFAGAKTRHFSEYFYFG